MSDEWLYEYGTGQPYAYSTDGTNYYLAPSGGAGWWAWRQSEWLYAARGGQPLGWFSGSTFFGVGSAKPLYYSG